MKPHRLTDFAHHSQTAVPELSVRPKIHFMLYIFPIQPAFQLTKLSIALPTQIHPLLLILQ